MRELHKGKMTWNAMHEKLDHINHDLIAISDSLDLPINKGKRPSLDLINPTIATIRQIKSCSTLETISALRNKYLQDTRPIKRHYGKESTKMQMDGLKDILDSWSSVYSLDLKTSRVIVVGAKGPREGMIEMQYFENRYRGLEKDEKYSRYVESPTASMSTIKIPDLINELGGHCLNKWIGLEELDNENAMNKDILAEHAPEVLKEHSEVSQANKISCCPYRRAG